MAQGPNWMMLPQPQWIEGNHAHSSQQVVSVHGTPEAAGSMTPYLQAIRSNGNGMPEPQGDQNMAGIIPNDASSNTNFWQR